MNLKKIKKNRYFLLSLFALTVLGVVTHLVWFDLNSIIANADWYYRTDEHVRSLSTGWQSWVAFQNAGEPNIVLYGYPLRGFLWPTLVNLGLSADQAIRITVFWPVAFLSFTSPFVYVYYKHKRLFIAIISALLYGSTTYFLRKQTNHLPIALVYALLPIAWLLFENALKSRKLVDWFKFVLLLQVMIIFELRITLIAIGLFSTFALFVKTKELLNNKLNILISGIFTGIINLFWILPTYIGGISSSVDSVTARSLFGNHLFDLVHAFTIHEFSWTGDQPNVFFELQETPLIFWILPLLAFISIISIKKIRQKREYFYFLILAVIGIFLTKQSVAPVEDFYKLAYNNIPVFNLFREASKFYIITAFAYLNIIVFTFKAVEFNKTSSLLHKSLVILLIVLSLIPVVYNLKPLVTREIKATFVSREISEDYMKIDRYFEQLDEDITRIAFVPRHTQWVHTDSKITRINLIELIADLNRSFSLDLPDEPRGTMLLEFMQKDYAPYLLALLDIEYLVIPINDIDNEESFFIYYGIPRAEYIKVSESLEYLTPVDIELEDAKLYQLKETSSKFEIYPEDNLFNSEDVQEEKLNFLRKFSSIINVNVEDNPRLNSIVNGSELALNPEAFIDSNGLNTAYLVNNTAPVALSIRREGQNNIIELRSAEATEVLHRFSSDEEIILEIDQKKITVDLASIDTQLDLGFLDASSDIDLKIYSIGEKNYIENGGFEDGLWQEQVSNCNNKDDNPQIKQELISENGNNFLRLSSSNHIACTSKELKDLEEGMYVLNYITRTEQNNTTDASVNDTTTTKILSQQVSISFSNGNQWQEKNKFFLVEELTDESEIQALFYGYNTLRPGEYVSTDVDSVNVRKIELIFEQLFTREAIQPDFREDRSVVSNLLERIRSNENLVENGDFESGLWQEEVSNCNNYDDNPVISQEIVEDAEQPDNNYLLLSTKRHAACVSTEVKVDPTSTYTLSLEYQNVKNPNGRVAVIYKSQNGTETQLFNVSRLKANSRTWNRFIENLLLPIDTESISIFLYSFQNDRILESQIGFDNVSLIKNVEPFGRDILIDRSIFTDLTQAQIIRPEFSQIAPYEYEVTVPIETLSESLVLLFKESYSDGWEITNIDRDAYDHLNVFPNINGYLLNADRVCTQSLCQDETVTLKLRFRAQDSFETGLQISTIAGGIFLLVFSYAIFRERKASKN